MAGQQKADKNEDPQGEGRQHGRCVCQIKGNLRRDVHGRMMGVMAGRVGTTPDLRRGQPTPTT